MIPKQVKKLKNGLYRVHWYNANSSLCAVGTLWDGGKWLAPVNWTGNKQVEFNDHFWELVESVDRIDVPERVVKYSPRKAMPKRVRTIEYLVKWIFLISCAMLGLQIGNYIGKILWII